MCTILNIETSTPVCSVSLSCKGNILFNKTNEGVSSHASLLGVYVAEALNYARSNGKRIDAVAVSAGPGSYTGLRIGVSEAKGLCYGLNVPLIAVSSLKILANAAISSGAQADLYCPMIDARRMEVYAAMYDKQLHEIREVRADIVDGTTYQAYLSKGKVLFFGNGAAKCKATLISSNALFLDHIDPLASAMAPLSDNAYKRGEFVDVAYFEPFYLKEFIATIPKNKLI